MEALGQVVSRKIAYFGSIRLWYHRPESADLLIDYAELGVYADSCDGVVISGALSRGM